MNGVSGNKIKVLACDSISKEGLKPLLEDENFEVTFEGKLTAEELSSIIDKFDALIVRSGTKVTKDVIEKAKNIKIIGRAGVGIDNIDSDCATEKGILVINAPSGNTIAACEHTIALILAMARKIPQADKSVKEGKWEKKKFLGTELAGKTAGIIGLGKIGLEVAKRLKSFEMKILAYDPYASRDIASDYSIELVEMEDLLKNSDIVTVHVPKNEKTTNMLNSSNLPLMKKTAFLVNCARGGIINEDDLLAILKEGKIAGAALDVFEKEPPEKKEFLEAENLILTPHLGASTTEAQEKVALSVAEDLKKFFSGKIPASACNFVSIDSENEDFRNILLLAERLGSFLAQMAEKISTLKFTYGGEYATSGTKPIRCAFLKGILSNILDEKVNLVNAETLARKRQILWEELENPRTEEFTKYLSAETGDCSLTGSFLEKPLLTEFNGYKTDISLDGILLVFSNKDVPGIIGKVGTLLGEAKINIASMDVARKKAGETAFTIIKLDEKPQNDVIQSLKKIPEISGVKVISLI